MALVGHSITAVSDREMSLTAKSPTSRASDADFRAAVSHLATGTTRSLGHSMSQDGKCGAIANTTAMASRQARSATCRVLNTGAGDEI
jgi:hypothetical protein